MTKAELIEAMADALDVATVYIDRNGILYSAFRVDVDGEIVLTVETDDADAEEEAA
jgi:hypothetical protein